ncbi:FliO/MopB family protein [Aeoliella mucimassa]|uniref:Flagellar biosynthesis protein, FliO n=1 Tax=Aeoliella mucimassa TaxID=2527972 RepID=A0A518AKP3_9BACT|nr:flagellar biosynthetic protein FliO [Aeoliella mucimassa]QDU55305.1 hypothetical protein Pan181_14940 [Aeoliella mucimassa]
MRIPPPLPAAASVLLVLAMSTSALAESLEPVAAQGPSGRSGSRPTSAYEKQDGEPLFSFATHEDEGAEPSASPTSEPATLDTTLTAIALPNSVPDGVANSATDTTTDGADSARRPHFGTTPSISNPTTAAGERSSAMVQNWARSSGMTAVTALAFVIGLFMLLAWFVKRGMPQGSQILPAEAVRMLGRIPLGGKQFGHLLHLGNKLVLVSVSQGGVEKLAEIDDPQEVVRMLAVCSKSAGKGSQKEFEEIFGQFAKEKTEPGFLGNEVSTTKGGRQYA